MKKKVVHGCVTVTKPLFGMVVSVLALFFSLLPMAAVAATISGTVYESDGATPITDGLVFALTGDPCSDYHAGHGVITADGSYVIEGLSAGSYYLKSDAAGNYLNEYWADPSSVENCVSGGATAVTLGDEVTGRNFQLDAGAAISGTVYESDGATPITDGWVNVLAGDPCSPDHIGHGMITADGSYVIEGLSAGTYYLQADAAGNYVDEYWADPLSVGNCVSGEATAVTLGDEITGRNFQLDAGAAISGTVYESDGATPITDGLVNALIGDPCSPDCIGYGMITADGSYVIEGLPAGSYYLQTEAEGNYSDEFWAGPLSVENCVSGEATAVTLGDEVTGRDFQLDVGAVISGTVYGSDGTVPITDGWVVAFTGDPCSPNCAGYGIDRITADGSYVIEGLSTGSYYLLAHTSGNYLDEYWADPLSAVNCGNAQYIAATAGNTVTGKNFQVDAPTATEPNITTAAVTNITSTGAETGGNATADAGASITVKGVCWSKTVNPTTSDGKTTDGEGVGSFDSAITGLSANTTYHVRAYATNSVGTAYGNDISFKTSSGSTLYVTTNGNCGDKSPCHDSIQSAIDDAATGSAILIAGGIYAETITLNESKSLKLEGGWNSSFSSQTENTILKQAPKAPRGSLTLQELSIKP